MAFATLGSFIPSTTESSDPIVITVNDTVPVGAVAILFISNDGVSKNVTSVSDSNGNDWAVYSNSTASGTSAIAVGYITESLVDSVDTVSVNLSSATRTIVRGAAYTGLGSSVVDNATRSAAGTDYYISFTNSGGDGWCFVCFGFPVDYVFEDTTISGWTNAFTTDDLTGLQSQQVFRKEVSDGVITCQNTSPEVQYIATAVVLPFTTSGAGQSVIVL